METISLESATIDATCPQHYELYEEMMSSIESGSDINFESALTEIPSSLTSVSYKTARDTTKSSDDKGTRPVSGISQDSVSTLDGVRTPFGEEESSRNVSIVSNIENLEVKEDGDLKWSLDFHYFDPDSHKVVWYMDSIILNPKDSNITVKITDLGNKTHNCKFTKIKNLKLKNCQLICKIVDKINDNLLTSSSIKIMILVPIMEIELSSVLKEITVKENDPINIELKIVKQSLKTIDLSIVGWYKDNEKIIIDNKNKTLILDDKKKSLILRVSKATKFDAGIYTIESTNSKKMSIKNNTNISILVLIETVKKTILKTASQEETNSLEHSEISHFSPIKNGESISGFSNENASDDTYHSAITTMNIKDVLESILKVKSSKIEIEEFSELVIEVEILDKLKEDPIWLYNKNIITKNNNIHITYETNKNLAKLIIKKCEKSHEGVYTCTVLNSKSDSKESIEIGIRILQKESAGFLVCSIEEIDLKAGEQLKLNMNAVGIEEKVLKTGCWYLNSKKLDLMICKGEFTISKNILSLNITNVTKDISGILQYKIEKPLNLCSPEVEIKIREEEKKTTKSSKNDLQLNVVKPQIEVIENKEILLEVEIVSGYLAMYQPAKWLLNNVPLLNRSVKITSDNKRCKLSIPLGKIKDSGEYKCTFLPAKGNLGEAVSAIFSVVVKDPKKGVADTKPKEIICPIIKSKSSNIEVDEFSGVSFDVDILGNLEEDPKWFFNNNILTNDENHQLIYTKNKKSASIKISKCEKSLEGLYKCIVRNPGNNLEESAEIILKVVVKETTAFLTCDIEEIDLKEGEVLKLNMVPDGIEESVLKGGRWYLNGKVLHLEKFNGECKISENLLSLHIPDVSKDLRGMLIFKIEKPKILSSSEIEIKIREGVKDGLKASKELKVKANKDLIEIIQNEEILLELEIISGNMETYQPPKWTINNLTISNKECKIISDPKRCSLRIQSCTKQDSGEYKCTFFPVKGNLGKPVTALFKVIIKKSTKSISGAKSKETVFPVLKSKSSNIEVDEFTEAILVVDILGKLEEKPEWIFNEKILTKDNIYELIYKEDKQLTSLKINKCEKCYEGVYKCVVKNPSNKAEESVEIFLKVVKKQTIGFLECDIEEIDLTTGEVLKLSMSSVSIDESILKNGCWYLNLKVFDLKKYKGESTVVNGVLTLHIPDVTTDIRGILQFKIDKPIKLSSPEIEIKIREGVKTGTKSIKGELKLKIQNSKIEIFENKEIELEIDILSGDPKMYQSPKWNLNNLPIANKSCKTTFDSKRCTFTIPNCQINDSGEYKCTFLPSLGKKIEPVFASIFVAINPIEKELKATNIKGDSMSLPVDAVDFYEKEVKTEVSMQLNAQPKDNLNKECSVHFKKDLYQIEEGKDIVLKVVVKCQSTNYSVSWSFNSEILELNANVSTDIKDNGSIAELVLKKCKKNRTGKYECVIENASGQISTAETKLEVIKKSEPLTEKEKCCTMTLICDETDILANEIDPLIISVEVQKWQNTKVQWYLNDEQFFDSYDLDSQFIDLYIDNPKRDKHTGTFKCEVCNNNNEKISMEIKVRFVEDIKNGDKDLDLLSSKEDEVNVIEGNQLQLSITSTVEAKLGHKAAWYKNNTLLDRNDLRLSISVEPNNYNLILDNTKLNDSGKYSLKVDDQIVEITVKVKAKTSEIKEKDSFKLTIPKPKFEMKDIELENEPQAVKFEFEIEECGPTKVRWYFENEEIEVENSEFIQWSCETYFALTIPLACERHCGKYTIKVANDMGYVKNEAKLSMILKAKIASLAQQAPEYIEESCCIAPMFTKKLKSIDLMSGDTLRLNCRVMSEPEPKILWTRDGESLDVNDVDKKMKIDNSFPNYDLRITDITVKDAGQYSCLASNFIGFDTTEALVTVDGYEMYNEEEMNSSSEINQIIEKPLATPILQIVSSNPNEILLEWTSVSTLEYTNVTYSIERQKFNKSNKWKSIKKNLAELTCSISTEELSATESHHLRCMAMTDFGSQSISNLVTIEIRVKSPSIPIIKPSITINDASCATITWQRGKCNNLTSDESFGKIFYCLEMKDNPKSSWQIVNNEIIKNKYSLALEPGISYMFRVSAFNDNGTSEPTPSVVTRIDRLKLVPEFSTDPPWLHIQGQPCLKWRAASVPEYCDKCVSGIAPEYKVEYKGGRSTPWKIYQDNITQCQIFLNSEIMNSAHELRVSCRNNFGQNSPTRSYRIQTNTIVKHEQDSLNLNKIQNLLDVEIRKKAEIESISINGLSLKWESWNGKQNSRYIIQKKSTYISEWTTIEPIVYGEDVFLDLKISENYSRNLRIIAIEDNGSNYYNGYNLLTIPSNDNLLPTIPENLKIVAKINIHEVSWTKSKNHHLVDLPISYMVQYKINNNGWITAADNLSPCFFANEKINDISFIIYRVAARNSFGISEFSSEIQVNTPLNVLANDQIVKSLRYFVIDYETIEIKWQLCDVVFDHGLNLEDFSFNVEKKLSTELTDWSVVDCCTGRSSILVGTTFEEENLFRIQPLLEGEKLTPSRLFRIYLNKELFVPDMSFTKPEIITDSIKDYFIEWMEPSIENGFSPEGLEICSVAVMMTDLQYELQYYIGDISTTRRIRTKDIGISQWMTIKDDIPDNSYFWENPDPTQEYVFRVIPRNQFGVGVSSRIAKLRPQITIPDFSLIRLNVEDQSIGSRSVESDIVLSWSTPKVIPERYTPYSLDVQYRHKGSFSEDEWITFKSNVKKTRISINELDPKFDYELRILPITEFGFGKPSMIIRRPRRHDKDSSASLTTLDLGCVVTGPSISEIYASLSHDIELKFNKTRDIKKDEIIFLKDDQPIMFTESKIKMHIMERDIAFLQINNIKEEDFGYYVVLSNDHQVIQTIKLIKSDAPTFLNSPLNKSVNLHENVNIIFKIDAEPPPTLIWRKNFKKIYSSYRTNITEDKENHRYSLKISKCILSDCGEYSVRAENTVGSMEVKFNLKIDAQPELKYIQMNEGSINDRYYVGKQISRGTYSTCQLIVEKSSHREFVGKLFWINNIGIGKMEFESLRNIRQRNIVELFDTVLNSSEYLYLIYEKLEGTLLVDHISQLSHWNEQYVQWIILQLSQAISHLHSLGIAHLDIQPSNIMIIGKLRDTVKLFGFSNATKEEDFEKRRNHFIPSAFSAPELLKGEPITLKCDIWSLGILSLICLYGNYNMDIHTGFIIQDGSKSLLSDTTSDFVAGCLKVNSSNRLSSGEAMRHEWFTNTSMDYNASVDHLKDDIVKLMTFPEEMVLNYSSDIQSAIEKALITPKPRLTIDSLPSTPSISQLSSRASSVSRDGINYDRFDQINEPCAEASNTYGNINEDFLSVDDKYVPNSARELLFTVPLMDQSFKPTFFGSSTTVVNLTCQLALTASDAISISWYKNQELLTDGSKIKLEVLSGGFLSCTIQNPGETDAGIYRCVARSRSLRAETSARLLVGDIPPPPNQPSVLFVNGNDVLLKWRSTLSATDDILYRVDLKEINKSNESDHWKTIGYTVDNQYLIEDFENLPCVARVVAKNKYGMSSYSIASSAFQNKKSKVVCSTRKSIINKFWISSTRQSKDSNTLHDLMKDMSSNDITLDIINEYYAHKNQGNGDVKILSLKKINGSFPDFVVQRNIYIAEKCPAIDLCLKLKYYHFPIVYGIINDLSLNLRYTIEEFVPGGDLISVLIARSYYSEFTVVTIMRQLMETVQFLHSNNIIHTKINPTNILIARRTNQLYDIKLTGLHHCQVLGLAIDPLTISHSVPHKMSTFQAPEYRYEGISKNETDIWSIGTLAFLLLTTQLPSIEDVCTESDVQCLNKNSNTLHLPTMHTHFRTPELALLSKFSKGSRKFIYNTLKKNPSERGNADYWLAHSWFRQDMAVIAEMQLHEISAGPLVEFMSSSS